MLRLNRLRLRWLPLGLVIFGVAGCGADSAPQAGKSSAEPDVRIEGGRVKAGSLEKGSVEKALQGADRGSPASSE